MIEMDLKILQSMTEFHMSHISSSCIDTICAMRCFWKVWPEVLKLFPCSTQLSTKFQLLIKTKLPTNEEVYCFKSLRCCIYPANKC